MKTCDDYVSMGTIMCQGVATVSCFLMSFINCLCVLCVEICSNMSGMIFEMNGMTETVLSHIITLYCIITLTTA